VDALGGFERVLTTPRIVSCGFAGVTSAYGILIMIHLLVTARTCGWSAWFIVLLEGQGGSFSDLYANLNVVQFF